MVYGHQGNAQFVPPAPQAGEGHAKHVNARAPDVLARLQAKMRSDEKVSDEMWDFYTSPILQPDDRHLRAAPFATNDINGRFVVAIFTR